VAAAVFAAAAFSGSPVQASTSACGGACANPSNQSVGTAETLTVSIVANPDAPSASCPTAVTAAELESTPVNCLLSFSLAAASSTNAGQDWTVMLEGGSDGVDAFVSGGALSSKLGIQYGSDDVVEFEAVPNGVATNMCLAVSTGSSALGVPTSGVSLAQCGQVTTTVTSGVTTISSPSAWILDLTNDANGYLDLISGTGQAFSNPNVLAVTGSGSKLSLTTQPLNEMNGVVSPNQMWSFTYGSQSAAAVKSGAVKHT
jgi:hypothetical protein